MEIVNALVVVRLNACVADTEAASVTRAVKLDVPATEVMPVTPPVLDKDNPDGSAPETNVQV